MYKTINAGATWTTLPASSVLQSKLLEYPEIVKLQFISKDVGWLLIEKKKIDDLSCCRQPMEA